MDIHTDPLYRHTIYDITSYFRWNVIAKNCRKAIPSALGRISRERFKRESQLDNEISERITLTRSAGNWISILAIFAKIVCRVVLYKQLSSQMA